MYSVLSSTAAAIKISGLTGGEPASLEAAPHGNMPVPALQLSLHRQIFLVTARGPDELRRRFAAKCKFNRRIIPEVRIESRREKSEGPWPALEMKISQESDFLTLIKGRRRIFSPQLIPAYPPPSSGPFFIVYSEITM
jgi:hypothetical protein